jgi:hypothetical protein
VAAWGDRPLAAYWGETPSRWTILAEPERGHTVRQAGRNGNDPAAAERGLELLRRVCAAGAGLSADPDYPPFVGGWIGWMSYELGAVLEPAAGRGVRAKDDRGWPLMNWCD